GAFRLWLALVVVLHHFTRIEIGKAPVLVFFALSGYWVHRVWNSRYSSTRKPWLTFIVSRWWRIAPVMVLSSLIALATLIGIHSPELPAIMAQPFRQAASALFAIGYAQLGERPVGPAWSLDVEMQFYLAAPLLALLVRRVSALAALLVAMVAFQIGLMFYPEVALPIFIPFFVLGMVASQHQWKAPQRKVSGGLLAVSAAMVVAAQLSPWQSDLLGAGGNWSPMFNIVVAALALPHALASVTRRGDRTDAVLADQSYIVYMLHWPVILVFRAYNWGSPVQTSLAAVGFCGVIGALSWAVWRHIDVRINQMRQRWVDGRRPDESVPRQALTTPLRTKGDDRDPRFA
ncbi:MAG: acyltransferase, partial [Novosphingobium sp.]